MPLAVVVVFQLAVLGIVVNSVVQFIRASSALPRRVLAVVSSLALLLLLSIYYARAVGATFRRIDAEWLSSQPAPPGAPPQAAEPSWALSLGRWFDETYFGWWMEHLPVIVRPPDPAFRQGILMLVVLAAAYAVRSAVWFFFQRRRSYPQLNEFVASYWSHITLWAVVLVFLRRVYAFGAVGIAVFGAVSLGLLLLGIVAFVGELLSGVATLINRFGRLLRLVWKWIAAAASLVARFVQLLRQRVWKVYERFLKAPVLKMLAAVDRWMERSSAAADRIIQHQDDIETGTTRPLPPPSPDGNTAAAGTER